HPEIELLRRFMAEVRGDDRPLKQLMRRHIVFDEKTEIDDTLRHGFPHSCGDRQEFTGVRSGPSTKRCRICCACAAILDRWFSSPCLFATAQSGRRWCDIFDRHRMLQSTSIHGLTGRDYREVAFGLFSVSGENAYGGASCSIGLYPTGPPS